MKTIIVTSTMCQACEQLEAEYPDVVARHITAFGPLLYILQALFGKMDIGTPIVIALAEGNGREARILLDLGVDGETDGQTG